MFRGWLANAGYTTAPFVREMRATGQFVSRSANLTATEASP